MGCRLKEWGVDYHFFSYVLGWCIPFLFVLFVLCLLPVGSLPGRNDLVAYSYMARGIFSSPLWFFLATWYVSVHFFRIAFLFPFSFSFFPSLYSFSFSLSFFCLCFLFLISRRSICPRRRASLHVPAQQLEPFRAQRPHGRAAKHASGLGLGSGSRVPGRGGGRR